MGKIEGEEANRDRHLEPRQLIYAREISKYGRRDEQDETDILGLTM